MRGGTEGRDGTGKARRREGRRERANEGQFTEGKVTKRGEEVCGFMPTDWVDRRLEAGDPGLTQSMLRAEAAHEIDNQADHQDQADAPAADHGAAKIKAAATEQEEQNNQDEY
jgi:hypothetical protein